MLIVLFLSGFEDSFFKYQIWYLILLFLYLVLISFDFPLLVSNLLTIYLCFFIELWIDPSIFQSNFLDFGILEPLHYIFIELEDQNSDIFISNLKVLSIISGKPCLAFKSLTCIHQARYHIHGTDQSTI